MVRPRKREDTEWIGGNHQAVGFHQNYIGLNRGELSGIKRIGANTIAILIEMKKQVPNSTPNFLRRGINSDGIEFRPHLFLASARLNFDASSHAGSVAMRLRTAMRLAFAAPKSSTAFAFTAFVMHHPATAAEFTSDSRAPVRSDSLIG